jgi:hypothetical protein
MFEIADDLADLQDLLDRSAAGAGPHLRRVITDEYRLSAVEVAARLTGMRLLALATVTSDGAGEWAGYRRALLDVYLPRYGAGWEALLPERCLARIDADRMFTFLMAPES